MAARGCSVPVTSSSFLNCCLFPRHSSKGSRAVLSSHSQPGWVWGTRGCFSLSWVISRLGTGQPCLASPWHWGGDNSSCVGSGSCPFTTLRCSHTQQGHLGWEMVTLFSNHGRGDTFLRVTTGRKSVAPGWHGRMVLGA